MDVIEEIIEYKRKDMFIKLILNKSYKHIIRGYFKMNREDFVNKNVYIFLKGRLKKFSFEKEELSSIKGLSIDAFDLSKSFISNDLKDLNYFENLEDLVLTNYMLDKPNIEIIENLKKITSIGFYNCEFKDVINLKGDYLKLADCKNIYKANTEVFKNILIRNCDLDNLKFDNAENIIITNCRLTNELVLNQNIKKLTFEEMKIDDKIEQLIDKLKECNFKLIRCEYKNDDQKKKLKQLENVKVIKNTFLTNDGIHEEEDTE